MLFFYQIRLSLVCSLSKANTCRKIKPSSKDTKLRVIDSFQSFDLSIDDLIALFGMLLCGVFLTLFPTCFALQFQKEEAPNNKTKWLAYQVEDAVPADTLD